MEGFIICSAQEAIKLMEHIDKDDIVVLNVINKQNKRIIHDIKNIKKDKGELLIKKANSIYYQNNDIFGTLALYGVIKEKNIIHNILFPQLE